jgi:hypothetical protein
VTDIAVLTAVYDGYDSVKPPHPQHHPSVEWICVTDGSVLVPSDYTAFLEPRTGLHPNRAAKTPKMRPWDYTDAEVVIWVDASFRVTSPDFASAMSAFVRTSPTTPEPIAQFVHPWRDCVYDELEESLKLDKYAGEPMASQVARYEAELPRHWGLWATGVIVRRRVPWLEVLGERWHSECLAWSYQDQLSEPYLLHKYDARPNTIPGDYFTSPWLAYEGSGRH